MNFKESVIKSQEELKLININKKYLIVKAKFGPSKETKIPLKLSEELAFFVGAIIGDGHLKKHKLQIVIELSNKDLINFLQKICLELFDRKFNISKDRIRPPRKITNYILMDSKAIYNLLNKTFEIPKGKKSHIVKIPKFIFQSNKSVKSAFLIGVMLTEGGRRHGGVGLSTASEQFWRDLVSLFESLSIKVSTDKWEHKKYKKSYYGISFKEKNIFLLMRGCRSGQTGQILLRCKSFVKGYA